MSFLNHGEQFAGFTCKAASGCSLLIWLWDAIGAYQSQIISITAMISTLIALMAFLRDGKRNNSNNYSTDDNDSSDYS